MLLKIMVEENIDETIENATEEETVEKETSIEEEALLKEKPELDVEQVKSQRDKLYARLKKEEEKRKFLEAELKKSVKPIPETIDEWKMKVDFLLNNKDVSENEFDHIATVAARKGISLSEAAGQEKDYIQYQREKVANEKKVPGSTSTGFSSSDKQISKDTPAENVDKILQERFKKSQESSKSV